MALSLWLSRRQTLSAALLLTLALHLCFFPFIWGNRTLLAGSRGVSSIMPNGAFYGGGHDPAFPRANDPGASSWVTEAYPPLLRHQYVSEKNLPLWNPYQAYGAPLAANMQSQPFNPLYFLFALNPGPRAFNLFVLFRLLLLGLFTYLYMRLFLPFAPSLAGGLVAMLSGYYILFFDMPHLSVEIFLPALFFAIERLLRRQTASNLVIAVAVVFLALTGGMPESALLLLTFGGAYFIFRLFDPAIRSAARRHIAHFVAFHLIAFALAAFLLIPFAEFLLASFNMHQARDLGHLSGLEHDRLGIGAFTYLAPLLFGPAWKPIVPSLGGFTALRDFFGILAALFALIAATSLFRRRLSREPAFVLFFLASSLCVLLKRFGAPILNSIGQLPLFNLVLFPKYEEPILAFSVSALCAFGVHQVLTQQVTRRRLIVCLSLAFLALAAIAALSIPPIRGSHTGPNQSYLTLAGPATLLFAASVLLLTVRTPRRLAPPLLLLLFAELAGNYIYPVYYRMTSSATDEADPYRGAPYIGFLQSHLPGYERIFARDGILYPSWAGSFQIADIRGLDALYYRKYLRFVKFFLSDEVPRDPRGGDLAERFTGDHEHRFDTDLKLRLLQLSSVKYLLSARPFTAASPLIQEILRQNAGRLSPGRESQIAALQFTIDGETRPVLFEHPPYDRLRLALTVTPATGRLFFSIAMDPALYAHPVCGDGVQFRLEAHDESGRIETLFDRYIDPKHNLAERAWIPSSVDLSPYTGHRIELLFTTTPGPAGDTCMDWAGWGDPNFIANAPPPPPFLPVYDREVKIFEVPNRLPRAALFSNVQLAPDDEASLHALASPALDLSRTAVVTAAGLTSASLAAARQLSSPAPAAAAEIHSYSSREVVIDAAATRPSLLVLNDSDYPGWKVSVDSIPSRWVTANYMFRGVFLQAGRHRAVFTYEPASFRAGAIVSSAGAAVLACWMLWVKRRSASGVTKTHLV